MLELSQYGILPKYEGETEHAEVMYDLNNPWYFSIIT